MVTRVIQQKKRPNNTTEGHRNGDLRSLKFASFECFTIYSSALTVLHTKEN